MGNWGVLLGGILLGGVLGVILLWGLIKFGIWYFKRRLKGWVESLAEGLQSMGTTVPSRITLRSQGPLAQWQDVARASREISDLKALGFEEIDSYTIDQMPGFHMSALVHPSHQIWGVVNEHPQAGIWTDLNTRYPDGSSFTVASAPETGIDQHPQHRNVKVPGGSAEQLLARMLSERPAGPASLTPDQFVTNFEGGYAEVMDWRLSRGGPTAEEVKAVAALKGQVLTEEDLKLAMQVQRAQSMAELDRLLGALFLEQSAIPASQWTKVEHRVIYIHDDLTEEELNSRAGHELPPGGTPRQRAEGHFDKLGVVKGPVEADVYVGPVGDDDEGC